MYSCSDAESESQFGAFCGIVQGGAIIYGSIIGGSIGSILGTLVGAAVGTRDVYKFKNIPKTNKIKNLENKN